jgi:two-component system chemotaxis response regulator CheB
MDVVMPEMDGLEALTRIMADHPTPVIILSELTSEGADTKVTALAAGAVDFFLKPPQSVHQGPRSRLRC